MTTTHTFWYLTRAAGLVSYVMLFVCVSLGLSMTSDAFSRRFPRFKVYDLHRYLSLLTLCVIVFHVFIVLPDRFIGFSLAELLVPFASPYQPLYMALGVFSLYLTGFIIVTFYLRPLVPYRAWRLIHYATFGAFALALVHGIGAGTDTRDAWALAMYATTGLVVAGLTVYRVLKGSARGLAPRPGATPASLTPAAPID